MCQCSEEPEVCIPFPVPCLVGFEMQKTKAGCQILLRDEDFLGREGRGFAFVPYFIQSASGVVQIRSSECLPCSLKKKEK